MAALEAAIQMTLANDCKVDGGVKLGHDKYWLSDSTLATA